MSRVAPMTLLLLVFALHGAQARRCFPTWDSMINDQPLIEVDHAIHLYHGSIGSQCLKAHGVNWGYDPSFMAGYPKTPFHDPSAMLSDLAQLLAGAGYRPAAYKICLFLTILLTPVLWWIGARSAGVSAAGAAIGTAIATMCYWTGFSRALLDSGLYAFLFASSASIACAGAWARLVESLHEKSPHHQRKEQFVRFAIATLSLSLTLLIHPTAVVLLFPSTMCLALLALRRSWKKTALGGCCAILFCLMVNAVWIAPMWRFWPIRAPGYIFLVQDPDGLAFALSFLLQRPLLAVTSALAVTTLCQWVAARRLVPLAALGAPWLGLTLLTFWGSGYPTRGLEPLRFQTPMEWLSALLAGESLALLWNGNGAATIVRWGKRVVALSAIVLAAFWVERTTGWKTLASTIVDHRPFPIGLTAEMRELIDWIRVNTDGSSRIMVEDQLRLREATIAESLHWTCLLPIYTGRSFVGGQYQVTPLPHHHVALGDFNLAGRAIDAWRPEDLRDYLRRYNVGWLVCWSQRTRAVAHRLPFAKPMGALRRHSTRSDENAYEIFRLDTESGWLARGKGRVVAATLNRIELVDVVPDEGRVTLRWHYLETLATTPPCPLERAPAGDDPIGFISILIDRPVERLVIENRYRWPDTPWPPRLARAQALDQAPSATSNGR